jgi:flagellar biosynthesis/type III secretory pathway chaperone
MTTFTQSQLGEMRQMTMAHQGIALPSISKATMLALLDHIDQLTADKNNKDRVLEREAAGWSKQVQDLRARVAELEAAIADAKLMVRKRNDMIHERDERIAQLKGLLASEKTSSHTFCSEIQRLGKMLRSAGVWTETS